MQPQTEYQIAASYCALLSSVFFNEPTEQLLTYLVEQPLEEIWPQYGAGQQQVLGRLRHSILYEGIDQIKVDYASQFLGGGTRRTYPWGSVYLDRNNLMFGPSTLKLMAFCRAKDIVIDLPFNEPLDHVGVLFLILNLLFERCEQDLKLEDIQELLAVHLLPWFGRFNYFLQQHSHCDFYRCFGELAEQFIHYWEEEMEVECEQQHLYK